MQRWRASLRIATTVLVAGATGCPDDEEPGPCDGVGELAIELRQRGEDALIVDGSELPIFPPPQGGVWTEIDVRLLGIGTDDVESLAVDVVDAGGTILAAELYLGSGLPLACRMDGSIEIDNMPVGFGDLSLLEQLDGVPATMTTTLTHSGGETVATVDVTLRADTF